MQKFKEFIGNLNVGQIAFSIGIILGNVLFVLKFIIWK